MLFLFLVMKEQTVFQPRGGARQCTGPLLAPPPFQCPSFRRRAAIFSNFTQESRQPLVSFQHPYTATALPSTELNHNNALRRCSLVYRYVRPCAFTCLAINPLKPVTWENSTYTGRPASAVIPVDLFSTSYWKGRGPCAIIASPRW